ncbi:MAG: VWA domain-containing protein [Planctomycetota bacterium]
MASLPTPRNHRNPRGPVDYVGFPSPVPPAPEPLLAVHVAGLEFALEPGRIYRLGSAAECEVRLPPVEGARPVVARLRLEDGACQVEPSGTAPFASLRPGDSLRLHGIELRVVVDAGGAPILPDPGMQRARALAAVRDRAKAAVDATRTESFEQVMARELRRAPWLTLSLALHALLLLLLWALFPAPPPGGVERAVFGFQGGLGDRAAPAPAGELPEVQIEPAEALEPTLAELPDVAVDLGSAPPEPREGPGAGSSLLRIGDQRVARARPRRSGGGDVLDGGVGDGGFREVVEEVRRTGLEVVFVFDSTGSMGDCIAATKAGIADMLQALRALVPDARFALVTYRDRGRREDYLLRELPLTGDFYAAINFVQSVEADGGGDVPEAVLDGMRAAFAQPFRPGARRVVVLAGDASPHDDEQRTLLNEVRRFARQQDTRVHALVTGKSITGEDPTDAFRRIAQGGRGECGTVEDHDRILQRVLSLAFGAEFEHNLDAVRRQMRDRSGAPPTWALDLARGGGDALARAFAADLVAPEVVDALLRRPRRAVSLELAELLGSSRLPASGLQAVAHVLGRQLQLDAPPIDPEQPRPLPPQRVAELRQRIELVLPD